MKIKIEDDFDLKKIEESGQCFRMEELERGLFLVPSRDRAITIRELPDNNYLFSCSEEEFDLYWRDYFDLDLNYKKIRNKIKKKDDEFLYNAVKYGQGIRILNQDFFETMISFIISQNRNIPAIKNSIELLSKKCEKEVALQDGISFYPFPSAENIVKLKDSDLSSCKLGYRDKYIKKAAEDYLSGKIDASYYEGLPDDLLLKELQKLYGVGKKVASCIMLFSLHRINAFPIDVWIKRIIDNEYDKSFDLNRYSPYNGIYQQYMFYYYRGL